MSWAEPADDMDTLSELPPPPSRPHGTFSRGRSSKLSSTAMAGGSKSERRLLMEAKATFSAALAEERRERAMARRRTKKCVAFLYFTFKVVGVATCAYTSGMNLTFVYMRPDLKLQNRLIRCYLVLFGIGGVLAELDTPFAKANFRALQKWWFKAPFYIFMAWLCLDAKHDRGTVWFSLELVAFVALQVMALVAVVLNVCLREVLERSGALGARKKARWRRGKSASSSRGGDGGGNRGRAPGGSRVSSSVSGGLGVSSFRDRDRRRPRTVTAAASSQGVAGSSGSVQVGGSGDRPAPEMVPERSGRLLSPKSAYNGESKLESYGSIENGGGGRGVGAGTGRGGGGGTLSGRIKWWLEGDEEESPSGQAEGEAALSPTSPVSASTTRSSGRGNWWEDSDGDDGSSSLASFALRDDASDAGSVTSGFSSVSAGVGGGRLGNSMYHGRGTAPMRQAVGMSSRRSARGVGVSGGVHGGSVAGSGQHVPLTAQALARNSNEPPQGATRDLGFAGAVGGGNHAGSAYGGSATGSSTGGFGGGGSLRSFGGGRAGRRSAREALVGPRRASSVSGEALRTGGASRIHGGLDRDVGRTVVPEAGGDGRTEDSRYSRGGTNGNSRRTPDVVDFSPF